MIENKKIISCGILFFQENKLLMCHPTGHGEDEWDLPKGCMEPEETYIEAAIRECFEETGFVCLPDNLESLGLHVYQEKKDLVLFKHKNNHSFKAEDAICKSEFFCKKNEQWLPEHDDFLFMNFEDVLIRACPQLRIILASHLK